MQDDYMIVTSMIDKEQIANMGLQLLNRDVLSDESLMELTVKLLSLVESLLKNDKRAELQSFLRENENHLTPTMRDLISQALKNDNPGKIDG